MESNLEDWLPHRLPMRFIDGLIEINEDGATCFYNGADKSRLELFQDETGNLPNVFLIEMMAQAIGVWAGYYRKGNEELSEVGFLLSVRGCKINSDITPADRLTVKIHKLIQDKNLASFEAEVISPTKEILASGKISVYQPTKIEYDQLFGHKDNI